MVKKEGWLANLLLISLILLNANCSSNSPPEIFRNASIQLKEYMENLEAIPIDENAIFVDETKGRHISRIDYSKKSEYIISSKDNIYAILSSLNDAKAVIKIARWEDDILFIRAIFISNIAILTDNVEFADIALPYIQEFQNYAGDIRIENWTKKQLDELFWGKFEIGLNDSLNEKQNLNAFFHLSLGAIFQHRKKNTAQAIEEYNRVINIDKDGFWGKQAYVNIATLKHSGNGSNNKATIK